MGTLYLVRHGQASFGADDYDQLSPLGQRQCERLGAWFAGRGLCFDAVLTGTLRRHQQTVAALATGALWGEAAPVPQPHAALDEYDSQALIRAVAPAPLTDARTPEGYRQHFRLLRDALAQWMAGVIDPEGMPRWHDFAQGVAGVLEQVRRAHDGDVLIVSSGGPIAAAAAQVLGAPAETAIELNMRLRNSALSEFTFNARHIRLLTWNTLPHLDDPALADWVTYA